MFTKKIINKLFADFASKVSCLVNDEISSIDFDDDSIKIGILYEDCFILEVNLPDGRVAKSNVIVGRNIIDDSFSITIGNVRIY